MWLQQYFLSKLPSNTVNPHNNHGEKVSSPFSDLEIEVQVVM